MFGHMRVGLCPPLVQSQAPRESHAKRGSSGAVVGVGGGRWTWATLSIICALHKEIVDDL